MANLIAMVEKLLRIAAVAVFCDSSCSLQLKIAGFEPDWRYYSDIFGSVTKQLFDNGRDILDNFFDLIDQKECRSVSGVEPMDNYNNFVSPIPC